MGILVKLSQARGGGAEDNFLRNLTLITPLNSSGRFPQHPHRALGLLPRAGRGVLVRPCQRFWAGLCLSKPFLFPHFLFFQKQEEVTCESCP